MTLSPAPVATVPSAVDMLVIGLSTDAPRALEVLPEGPLREETARALDAEEFTGKEGATLLLRTLGQLDAPWLLLVGVGAGDACGLRIGAGMGASIARDKGLARVALALPGASGAVALGAIAEGVVAGNYRYENALPESRRKAAMEQAFVLTDDKGAQAALDRGATISRARNFARDLTNATPEDLNPATLAAAALSLANDRLTVTVKEGQDLVDANMVGILAVGRASVIGPRYVHMTYTPEAEPVAEVAIVGKGVTFDAGGLSIKTSEGMATMRCDMGGAGAVIGAMSALTELGLPVKVHGIFGAVENLIAGNSYKLGDVLRYNNGVTVEVLNTDAEGRLVLADCLIEACKLPVSHVIDLATLTGAAWVALGEAYYAMFTDKDSFAEDISAAAASAGEGVWRMPLEPSYKEMLKSDWAQMKNIGGKLAGATTAALFLSEFVSGVTWAHLDIAGPAFLSAPRHHLGKGGSGAGTTTLLHWLSSIEG